MTSSHLLHSSNTGWQSTTNHVAQPDLTSTYIANCVNGDATKQLITAVTPRVMPCLCLSNINLIQYQGQLAMEMPASIALELQETGKTKHAKRQAILISSSSVKKEVVKYMHHRRYRCVLSLLPVAPGEKAALRHTCHHSRPCPPNSTSHIHPIRAPKPSFEYSASL